MNRRGTYQVKKNEMRGKIKCGACMEPLRDHQGFGPCPYYETGMVVDIEHYKTQKKARQSPK